MQTQSNRTDVVTVTFLEGMNLEDFGDTLEESGVCGKEEFLEIPLNFGDYTAFPDTCDESTTGWRAICSPDTYDFYQDSEGG